MKQIRNKIDEIDKKILRLLSERFNLVIKIAKIKNKEGLIIKDSEREDEIFKKLEKEANKLGINPQITKKIYTELLKESRRLQREYK